MTQDATLAGQAVYSKTVLSIYDLWVLGVSNHYFWQCPTRLIREQFVAHVSPNHLDVGVGSGYYLKHCLPDSMARIGLLDLNQNSLEKAAQVIRHRKPEKYCEDVLTPLTLTKDTFDSISINYLLHCLPGSLSEKSVVFKHLKAHMSPGGVLFGSTIIGSGTQPNFVARKLMAIYNKKGIFSNYHDDVDTLTDALNAHFSEVNVEMVGCVALFSGVNA